MTQLEPPYRDNIVDFSKASILERTVLMCMERISELEGRADAAAEALRVQCERHRATLVKCIMCASGYNLIFVDVMAWLKGVTPTTARAFMCDKKMIDLSDTTGVNFTGRARELCMIARRGVDDDGKSPPIVKRFRHRRDAERDDHGRAGGLLGVAARVRRLGGAPPSKNIVLLKSDDVDHSFV